MRQVIQLITSKAIYIHVLTPGGRHSASNVLDSASVGPNPIFGCGSVYGVVSTEVDAKSPERQDFCAKTSDDTPPGRLPRQCAYLKAGTAPKADCIRAHHPRKSP